MGKEADDEELLPSAVAIHMVQRPSVEDFVLVVRVIGESIAFYNVDRLTKLYDYVQSVRRSHTFVPESKIHAMAECACAMLDSFFATMEPFERMEKLVEEFRFDTMWQGVLRALYNAGKDGLAKTGINDATKARMPGVVLEMAYLSNVLIDFQNRELVEFFPSSTNAQEAAYALTMLGRQLFAVLGLDKPKCGACGRVL